MARFTFGAGNARKLLRLPLYALGFAATLVVPRTAELWVVGSGIGLGEGALPLYRAARARLGETTRVVWLATTDAELAEARGLGFDAELKRGWRGFRLTLRARVIVVTHGFGDVNRYATRGGFVVQLWHGIPLKRLHLDSPATLRVSFLPDHRVVRALVARAYRMAGRGIGLFPVASELVAARIASAFGVPRDRIVVTGDPRDDLLVEPRSTPCSTTAAPAPSSTPRPGATAPPTRSPRPPSSGERSPPGSTLATPSSTFGPTRSARATTRAARRAATASGCSAPTVVRDVNTVLPEIDVLLTDYSSIAFDYALLGRPIVFIAADLEHYAKRRGLYDGYREFSGGRYVTSWDAALARLEEALAGDEAALAHSTWLRDEYVDVDAGIDPGRGATERVLDEIAARLGGRAAPTVPTKPRPAVALESAAGSTVRLRIAGTVPAARLEGRRARVDGVLTRDGADTLATFELLAERWGSPGLALPSDSYRLLLETGTGWSSRTATAAPSDPALNNTAVNNTAATLEHLRFRATVAAEAGGLVVRVAPPLAADERGAAAQRRLEKQYRRARPEPEDAVFLEKLLRAVGILQSTRDRPCARRTQAGHPSLLERRRRVDRGSGGCRADRRGNPRVVARARGGPGARRERLAAQAVPPARPPEGAADLARHDAQATRPRPERAASAPASPCGANATGGMPCSRRTRTPRRSSARPTRCASRSGRRATRATTCCTTRSGLLA